MSKFHSPILNKNFTNSGSLKFKQDKQEACKKLDILINAKFQAKIPYQKGVLERSKFVVEKSRQWSRILTRAYGEAAAEVLVEISLLVPQVRAARTAGGIIRSLNKLSNSIGPLTATAGKVADAQRSARQIKMDVDNSKRDVKFFLSQITKLNTEIERLQVQKARLGCP